MLFSSKVEMIDRNLLVDLKGDFYQDQVDSLIIEARQAITDALRQNQFALGHAIPYPSVLVDGQEDRSFRTVKIESIIVAEFDVGGEEEFVPWISDMLEQHSPVGATGRYAKSHIVLADGVEIQSDRDVPSSREYVFINTVPYARKIERGVSSQAPDGVYQVVAVLARRRFRDTADIFFEFRNIHGQRNPAIIARTRGSRRRR